MFTHSFLCLLSVVYKIIIFKIGTSNRALIFSQFRVIRSTLQYIALLLYSLQDLPLYI